MTFCSFPFADHRHKEIIIISAIVPVVVIILVGIVISSISIIGWLKNRNVIKLKVSIFNSYSPNVTVKMRKNGNVPNETTNRESVIEEIHKELEGLPDLIVDI